MANFNEVPSRNLEAYVVFQTVINSCHRVVEESLTVLQVIAGKRVTLEEKMIHGYLIQLCAKEYEVLKEIVRLIKQNDLALDSGESANLLDNNTKTVILLQEFLKAALYDLNYLEQYFEHDFYSQLEGAGLLQSVDASLSVLRNLR